MDATPLLLRTPVSQRHCRRDADQLLWTCHGPKESQHRSRRRRQICGGSGLSRARSV